MRLSGARAGRREPSLSINIVGPGGGDQAEDRNGAAAALTCGRAHTRRKLSSSPQSPVTAYYDVPLDSAPTRSPPADLRLENLDQPARREALVSLRC